MKFAVLILLSVVCVSWGKNASLTLLKDAKQEVSYTCMAILHAEISICS